MSAAQLSVKNVSISFGGTLALNNVSFEVMPGEILAVIGPNGAGKTSLLNCVNGFYRPDKGSILFEGREVTRTPTYQIAQLGIARTFQNIALYTGLSTLDNLMAARHIHMRSGLIQSLIYWGAAHREEIEHRRVVEEIISFLEIEHIRKAVVGALPQLEGSQLDGARVKAMIGAGSAPGFAPLTELYQTAADGSESDTGGDDPFAIISTAAVAGAPRGAVLTHNNMLWAGFQLAAALGLTARDCHLAALPLFHIAGLGLSLGVMQAGGANVILEAFDPARASLMIDEHEASLMAAFPPVLSMMLDARAKSGAHWKSLRHVVGLDAPDTIKRLVAETGAKFWSGFGQSETTGFVTLARADEKPGSAGRPVPLARVRCVNEAGEDAPAGEAGEIVAQGPMVFAGYWRDPDATDFTFRRGWHHTGDVGKFDAEGYLYYVGRKPEKELIKSGGENVYPAEVERVIQEMPEVAAVCVIGVPDAKWGEAVKAVVELAPGKSLTAEQIISGVAGRIAAYKKPQRVDFVETLPRQSNGEIDRAAVKSRHG